MILKRREIPKRLLGYEAAIHRLEVDSVYYKRIERKLWNSKAGYGGEQIFDEEVSNFQYPYPNFFLHDLTLKAESLFQIDSLFATPSFFVVFDIKNLAGEIAIKETHLERINNNEKMAMENPFDQLRSTCDQLMLWLKREGVDIPIYSSLVFPFPKLVEQEKGAGGRILLPRGIKPYLRRIPYKPVLDDNKFEYILTKLLNSTVSFNPYPIFKRERIPLDIVLTGILCTRCHALGMKKVNKGWLCTSCELLNPDAHIRAFQEYAMLISNQITLEECKWFFRVNDYHQIRRILKSMNFREIGAGRHRKYLIEFDE